MSAPIKASAVCLITNMLLATSVCLGSGAEDEAASPLSLGFFRRDGTVRLIHHHDVAIRQALLALGQALNPVKVVGPDRIREMYRRASIGEPPPGLDAFRAPGDMSDPHIYVNAESTVYREAYSKPSGVNTLKLAATLVHEQVHNTDREFAAYRLQSDFVRSRLNSLPSRQAEAAARFMETVDARARALARVEHRNLRAQRLQLTR